MEFEAAPGGNLTDQTKFQDALSSAMIERARALRPLLQKTAAQTERDRRVVPEVIEAIGEAGLWEIKLPLRWGGLGLPAAAWSRVEQELAKGCPSTAWNYHILTNGAWIASLGSDALQEDIFADGTPRIAGGMNPPGRAVPVDGGYRVSGRWSYNSGFHHATWRYFICTVEHADGSEVHGVTIFVPAADASVEEDWYAAGMRGSGSHTGILDDVFVPAHRAVLPDAPLGHHHEGKRHVGAPSDYWPLFQLVSTTILGPLIGIAQAVLEQVVAGVARKPLVYTTYARASDSSVIQRNIGEAAAKIETASLVLDVLTRNLDTAALEGRTIDYRSRALGRGMIGATVEQLCTVVDKLMFAGGASAFLDTSDLQRYWRDLNIAARHAFLVPDVNYEVCGRAELEIEPNIMPDGFV
jgi:3-hydroxy-9,10-secoandrosta-1,3,5(10)-triene-9,17-dione monooxygenase